MERGNIGIKMFNNGVRHLNNIRYAPRLKRNLISIRTLDAFVCAMKIDGGVIKVIKGATTLMKDTIQENGLYILYGHTTNGVATIVDSMMVPWSKLSHQRHGHISVKALAKLR